MVSFVRRGTKRYLQRLNYHHHRGSGGAGGGGADASKPFIRRCYHPHTTTLSATSSEGGYQSIGSFHSADPQSLLTLSDSDYTPPSLPFDTTSSAAPEGDRRDLLSVSLDRSSWTFLNHGAFGAPLSAGLDRAHQWRLYQDQQPLRFFDRDLLPHLAHTAKRINRFVNPAASHNTAAAAALSLALLPNVTSGLNAVIRGYMSCYGGENGGEVPWHSKSNSTTIVTWDVGYGSLKKMARHFCRDVVEIPLLELVSLNHNGIDDDTVMIQALEKTLETRTDWTNALFVVDHTTSNTALNFPIEALCQKAKEVGMITVVDGAHGMLAQPLNLENDLPSVDIYLGNCHKWLCCPRGVAFVWCPHEQLRETLLRTPAVVSHGIDDGFFNRFVWDGCRDYTAALSVPAVLDVWETADPNMIRQWMGSKLIDATRILSERWYPVYANDPESWPGKVTLGCVVEGIHGPGMALVKLPPTLCGNGTSIVKTSTDAKKIQDYLYHCRIEVPIKCINGVLFVRISCHIYNELEEYDRLAIAMQEYRG